MSIEIRRVETRGDLKRFIRFPFGIYRGDRCWVPPLDQDEMNTLRRDRNPAFDHSEADYWMAYRGNRAVGRIAGLIVRPALEKWGQAHARFGWFDVEEDFEAAQALLGTVEAWARSKGMVGVNGPMGFTDFDKEGLLVEGFDEVGTAPMIYNRPWYPAFLDRLGYRKDVDWIECKITAPGGIPDKVKQLQEMIGKRAGIHLHPWKRPGDLEKTYGRAIFQLIEEAFSGLYGTVPLTSRQVEAYMKQYMGFLDPRFTKVVVDRDERLVGCIVALPSLSVALQKAGGRLLPLGWFHLLQAMRHPREVDILMTAIRPEYQARGAVAFLMTSFYEDCIKAGVQSLETSGMLESNLEAQQVWKHFEARQHKRRRVYVKEL